MIGTGILKGMAVTARNFVGSYFEKERLITVQYPEERSPLPENYRNFPFLLYDTDDSEKGLRCVACKICEKECPPQCIYIIKSEDKKPDYQGKPQFYPATFDIDISVCMSCQICVEVCPFEAIKMDKVFELSRRERFDALLMRKKDLAKSNQYYHSIHPSEAAEVDARLAEAAAAAEAKKKAAAAAAAAAAAKKAAEAKAAEAAKSATPAPTNAPEKKDDAAKPPEGTTPVTPESAKPAAPDASKTEPSSASSSTSEQAKAAPSTETPNETKPAPPAESDPTEPGKPE